MCVVGGVGERGRAKAAASKNGWYAVNLNTPFERMAVRAGIKPWPKLMNNLWASCATDLLAEFPIANVTRRMGRSAAALLERCAQPRTDDFDRAGGRGDN